MVRCAPLIISLLSVGINHVSSAACDWLFAGGLVIQADTCFQLYYQDEDVTELYTSASYKFECDSSSNSGTFSLWITAVGDSPCSGTVYDSTSYDFDLLPVGACNSGINSCSRSNE